MSWPSSADVEAARASAEAQLSADLRALTLAGEQLSQAFARANQLRPTDLRALMYIITAESEGKPVTAGQLGSLLGLSSAAITYLVERMIASEHIQRQTDSADRRKVILRYAEHGMEVAGSFFGPLGTRTRDSLADHSAEDLHAAHRVLETAIAAMREHYAEITEPNRTTS